MKFNITFLLAAMAAVAVVNPVAVPEAEVSALEERQINCQSCKCFYEKCLQKVVCWLDPAACAVTCRIDTCRAYNGYCKRNCEWKGC